MRGARSGVSPEENSRQAEQLSSLLTAWESSETPFSEQYVPLSYDFTQANPPAPVPGSTIGSSTVVQAAYSTTSTRYARLSEEDWAPGVYNGRVTSRHVLQLVGVARTKQLITAPRGSLKQEAIEAKMRMEQEDENLKKARRQVIDFGSEVPFKTVPEFISTASSATLEVNKETLQFAAFLKRKEPELLVAVMITRMLWFLRPDAFPEKKDDRGVLCVAEMVKKIGAIGWVKVKGKRLRNEDCELRLDEDLLSLYK
ncbi:hypothetical protein LEL_10981 [Akanthomyces lecanii RCEF 1005]|uniref:Uncharacterized protein n=1 Tax=Akanthomyces lecanii RCEF 1005 TaxID=1081108 RepID=A0A167NNX2_CORDF|nr:hypothetical protein LEL_10981 [Akanthomyces lecanii RCEF 1005]